MFNLAEKTPTQKPSPTAIPPLENGDRLSRAEFERRYWLHPEIKKAELIEGVVYVASPLYAGHGVPHYNVNGITGRYVLLTEGLIGADNTSVRLDNDNEAQPDTCIFIDAAYGGQVQTPDNEFIEGAPEFVIEVARSSASYDLHDKKSVYRRNGVREYVVLSVFEQHTYWFELRDGAYIEKRSDDKGVFKSQVLGGFWFNSVAYWQQNWQAVFKTLDQGMDSAEYQRFQQKLLANTQ